MFFYSSIHNAFIFTSFSPQKNQHKCKVCLNAVEYHGMLLISGKHMNLIQAEIFQFRRFPFKQAIKNYQITGVVYIKKDENKTRTGTTTSSN